MKHSHDVYEMVKTLTHIQGAKVADLALAVGRQQSALQRSLQGNPTIKLLMECGWALGCDWHWFGLPLHRLDFFIAAGTIRFEPDAPIHTVRVKKVQQHIHAQQFKDQPFDPADPANRDKMAQFYPPKALEGDNGKPLDSRFIQAPVPEYDGPVPSHAARRTEDATVAPTPAGPDVPPAPQHGPGPAPTDAELMRTEQGRNTLRTRLTDVDCGGWVLSDSALEAGRVPVSVWTTTGGWDIDKMKAHNYLVEARLLGIKL